MATAYKQKNYQEYEKVFKKRTKEQIYYKGLTTMRMAVVLEVEIDFQNLSQEDIKLLLFVLEKRVESKLSLPSGCKEIDVSKLDHDVLLYTVKVLSQKKSLPAFLFNHEKLLEIAYHPSFKEMLSKTEYVKITGCFSGREKEIVPLLSESKCIILNACEKICSHNATILSLISMLKTTKIQDISIECESRDIQVSVARCLVYSRAKKFTILPNPYGSRLFATTPAKYVSALPSCMCVNVLDLTGAEFTNSHSFNTFLHLTTFRYNSITSITLPLKVSEEILSNARLDILSGVRTLSTLSMGGFVFHKHVLQLSSIASIKHLIISPLYYDGYVMLSIGAIAMQLNLVELNIATTMHIKRHYIDGFLSTIARSKSLECIHFDTKSSLEKSIKAIISPVNTSLKVWHPITKHCYNFLAHNSDNSPCRGQYDYYDHYPENKVEDDD